MERNRRALTKSEWGNTERKKINGWKQSKQTVSTTRNNCCHIRVADRLPVTDTGDWWGRCENGGYDASTPWNLSTVVRGVRRVERERKNQRLQHECEECEREKTKRHIYMPEMRLRISNPYIAASATCCCVCPAMCVQQRAA